MNTFILPVELDLVCLTSRETSQLCIIKSFHWCFKGPRLHESIISFKSSLRFDFLSFFILTRPNKRKERENPQIVLNFRLVPVIQEN